MVGSTNPKTDRLSIPDRSRPDAGNQEDALSVQVNVDGTSNRGLSVPPAKSPLPASPSTKAAEPPSRIQTTNNSQNSTFSSQQPSAEHFLRDLITPTESASDALSDALRRLKRPHEGEDEDEPLAKRDRLGDGLKDELEELHAMAVAAAGISIATSSSGLGMGDHAASRPAKENPALDIANPSSRSENGAAPVPSSNVNCSKTPRVDGRS
ncbi:hypothetical protein B0T18DRAFT_387317 [Schizothecium vesticola]|uniref:Uncharacterized protein n=1 Tax=Schizothecium vesticola TaxID=314040 RepID=A0AA40K9L6_9PEZI|nr:hypothetical protein B0T18DRAFT_387317 [Schizothecium vesticola]